ncbi:hypothetical protein BDY21DRAFT_190131 [Lineolata rhizophorae]|uniref:Uncharacterized protein n=1 Tax=Lineolata rhizophorae TaxID=578093 RepID=A0A6A6P5Z3_9PEZI|nr:hypothetical protein BDY21DRAFT_190131 [Lineolata rhizophorae]
MDSGAVDNAANAVAVVNVVEALSTSTVFSTKEVTVTNCASTSECPESVTVVTEVVEVSTTVCPVTLTETSFSTLSSSVSLSSTSAGPNLSSALASSSASSTNSTGYVSIVVESTGGTAAFHTDSIPASTLTSFWPVTIPTGFWNTTSASASGGLSETSINANSELTSTATVLSTVMVYPSPSPSSETTSETTVTRTITSELTSTTVLTSWVTAQPVTSESIVTTPYGKVSSSDVLASSVGSIVTSAETYDTSASLSSDQATTKTSFVTIFPASSTVSGSQLFLTSSSGMEVPPHGSGPSSIVGLTITTLTSSDSQDTTTVIISTITMPPHTSVVTMPHSTAFPSGPASSYSPSDSLSSSKQLSTTHATPEETTEAAPEGTTSVMTGTTSAMTGTTSAMTGTTSVMTGTTPISGPMPSFASSGPVTLPMSNSGVNSLPNSSTPSTLRSETSGVPGTLPGHGSSISLTLISNPISTTTVPTGTASTVYPIENGSTTMGYSSTSTPSVSQYPDSAANAQASLAALIVAMLFALVIV